jgi:hypothetical protein
MSFHTIVAQSIFCVLTISFWQESGATKIWIVCLLKDSKARYLSAESCNLIICRCSPHHMQEVSATVSQDIDLFWYGQCGPFMTTTEQFL